MEVKANVGRYDPYVMVEQKFFSLTEDTPEEVSIEKAIEIIEAKQKRLPAISLQSLLRSRSFKF